jgi:diguanylate cyclase (GGDEF)-like protein
LDINGYISVINKVNLQDWFNPEITDYLKLQNLKFKFFEINDNENYYISELPNKRIMLIKHPVKLDRFYITKAELLLNYVKIKLNEVKLYNKSVTDKLTGLYNHGYMNIIIPEEIKRVKKFNQLIGFILFDIDFFKKFNDTYGHQTGDEVLKFISKIFKENIRNCDIPIRYGGEEFLCVCPDIDKKHLYYIADNLRQIIANSVLKYDNKKLSVNISGGISIYPEESYDYMELINIADKRLYKSKENGRNQITYE